MSHEIIVKELERQRNTINLIASENYPSIEVLKAVGSVLMNKYSEGYPNKRYYAGNKFIDESEILAIKYAKKLFKAEHANVQPHSGTQANMAAYFSLLKNGDRVLAMGLAHGGHLSHGHKISFSGKFYNFTHYGVDKDTGIINMENIRSFAKAIQPKMIVAGASAYPREIDFKAFSEIADEVGAYLMADIAHIAGLVATGLHNNPFPYADVVTTTTQKTLRGPRGGLIMCKKEYAEIIDSTVFPGIQGGPMDNIILAKAVCFEEALKPEFKDYQRRVIHNSKMLGIAMQDKRFRLVSNGTDNHMILVDLTNKNITGKYAQHTLEKAGIIVNMNMIPFDKRSPLNPSGIRLGTPAITTRGMNEMELIATLIEYILSGISGITIKNEVKKLCEKHPIYPNLQL